MQTKTFQILSGITVAAVVLAIVAILGQPRFESTDTEGGSILPTLVKDSERLMATLLNLRFHYSSQFAAMVGRSELSPMSTKCRRRSQSE